MDKNKKLIKNVSLIGLGSIASKFLFFALFPLYTAVLTTAEYGIADTITTAINLSVPVFMLMIYDGVMRFSLDKTKDKSDVFSVSFYTIIVAFFAFFLFSLLLRNIEIFRVHYLELLLFFLSWAIYQTFCYFCRGIEKVGIYAIAGIIATVGAVLFNILFLLVFKWGLEGYFLAYISSYFASAIYMIFAAKLWRYIKLPSKVDPIIRKEMIEYSTPLVVNSISWWLCNFATRYVVIFIMGYSAAGIFAVSTKIPTIITTVGMIFSQAWRISAVENFGSEESKKFYSDIFELYSTFAFSLAAVLILLSKPLASILFANDFFIAWQYSAILVIGSCVFILLLFIHLLKKPRIY